MKDVKILKIAFLVSFLSLVFLRIPFASASATTGWWGMISASGLAVRTGPGTKFQALGYLGSINRVKVLATVSQGGSRWYKIDGGVYPGGYVSAGYIRRIAQPVEERSIHVPSGVSPGDYWIDVNMTKQTLTFFDYRKPVFATYISTGKLAGTTSAGIFRIWEKLVTTRMHGGPPFTDHIYNLLNVPWVMYYNGSDAVHGTYWHDKFGTPQSAGCTNITQGDAQYIFDRVHVGTVVYNHY